ncbi:hypothetical protein YC2023_019079 [Brassica napus]
MEEDFARRLCQKTFRKSRRLLGSPDDLQTTSRKSRRLSGNQLHQKTYFEVVQMTSNILDDSDDLLGMKMHVTCISKLGVVFESLGLTLD